MCKLVDVHPDNPGRGLPSISATVLVPDTATGRLGAVLDGRTLTELRTAAASAVAADELAPVADAVAAAKLVVTCTLSEIPVLAVEDLRPGATVISVGSFEAHRREVPPELVHAAHVVVDDVDTALAHAGPLVEAIATGELRRADLTTLGEVLVGTSPGRRTPGELVFYNSVGLGIQDAAAAHAVLATARRGLAAVGLSRTLPTGLESFPDTAHP